MPVFGMAWGHACFERATRSRPELARFVALLLLQVLVAAEVCAQPITVDATSSAGGDVQVLSWSHTVSAGTYRILIVGVSIGDGMTTSVSSVTYGGVALTRIGATNHNDGWNRVELWKLVNPPVGTASVVVTQNEWMVCAGGAVSFFNVDATTPHSSYTWARGVSTAPSVAVSSAAGEVVIDTVVAMRNANSLTVGGGQTQRWNRSSGTGTYDIFGGGSTEAGQSSVTMSWTLGASKAWVIGAVALKPAKFPDLTLTKSSAVLSDPLNGTTNPKRLPGSDVRYTIQVTNQGPGPADADSMIVTEPLPASTKLFVGNYDGASGPVKFTDGTPASGLSYIFTSLGSSTDNIEFSNNNRASYAYTPTPDDDSLDANVTHFRVKPQGTMGGASGGQNPSFTLDFKVRVQ
jgi:uncharacterized repeat protein (TIGR01451 family)